MKLLRILKETFLSSLPLAAVTIIVCGFIAPLDNAYEYIKLLIGYIGVVVGQSLFLVGLDISILPVGKVVGESLIKLKKVVFIIFFGFLFGLFAEVAEPALNVFAGQANKVMPGIDTMVFVWVMASGIGVFVGFALFRIMKDINIKIVFAALYIVLFLTAFFVPEEFIALAFDGSGATTGDVSVPFMLALGMGVCATMSKRKTNDDTFGIIGMASVGPILAVFIYGMFFGKPEFVGSFTLDVEHGFLEVLIENIGGVALALLPVILLFLPFQLFAIKLPKKEFVRILLGMIPVYAGLLIFLFGVDYGFAFAGKHIGESLLDYKWLLIGVSFILGAAITLSEPAVTVLGDQLEEITNGHIKKLTIRLTLAVGIGFASILSVIKIITEINIMWFLIPLYALALCMMKFSSKMFVGLAFDSGGVSGGSLTAAFLTPFALGIANGAAKISQAPQSILTNGFGIIAFLSVTPLIAVQTLGIIYEIRYKKVQKLDTEHEIEDLEELLSLSGEVISEG